MLVFLLALVAAAAPCEPPLLANPIADANDADRAFRENYTKYEYRIPMRDGVKLYTVAYVPRERSHPWPALLVRTPYGVTPGVDVYPDFKQQPRSIGRFAMSTFAIRDGFIFVHQDVRGKSLSEGSFVDVRPRSGGSGPDEATDAYDTIEFLTKQLPSFNGRVGVWGISYPGFYAAQAAIEAHPAVKAVSPQAPVTDWFLGDDFHHNGALFLLDAFNFYAGFGKPRPAPTRKQTWGYDMETGDAYEFFLGLGPLANVNTLHFKGEIAFWNDLMAHPNRDAWWKVRDPRPHYAKVKPAVLVVGGLFDAEDLWGAVATYQAFNTQSPGADVRLVLGPWRHGGWARTDGDALGDASFGWKTAKYYQENIELPFFRKALKGCPDEKPAEAIVFETGTNLFNRFDRWPPKSEATALFFSAAGTLTSVAPKQPSASTSWVSDPHKPVPYRANYLLENDGEYMTDDQRFATRRTDVVSFQTPVLSQDLTVAGPIDVEVWFATTGTDADLIVKLIDVAPFDKPTGPNGTRQAGAHSLIRAEVMSGRFREGFEVPRALAPGEPTRIRFALPDVSHTFRASHRLMIQVQSTWFPLVARNPQTFVEPAKATEADFQVATHRLFHEEGHASKVTLPVVNGKLAVIAPR
jgi:putative CocE/NonD family hydrolase